MLGSRKATDMSCAPSPSRSTKSLVRPRSSCDPDDDNETTSSSISKQLGSPSSMDGASPAKKRRLNEEDLIAREELGSDDEDWEANDRFDIVGHLGDGTYGIVYKAIDRHRQDEIVAVKKLSFQLDENGQMPVCVVREIANLKYLQRNSCSFNIIRLLDVVPSDGRYAHEFVLHMVFEYMEQDLDSFIRHSVSTNGHHCMEAQLLKDLFYQMVAGVEWMHLNNVIHRDLKPQNILITDRTLKIADFGMSRCVEAAETSVLSTQVITQWYRSPEVLLGSTKYTKAVDIWSVGCIFAEMMSGRALFASKRKGDKWQLEEILQILGTPKKDEWPQETPVVLDQFKVYRSLPLSRYIPSMDSKAEHLLMRMLKFQSTKRITAREILHDDYFSSDVDSCATSTVSTDSMDTPSPSPSPISTPLFTFSSHSSDPKQDAESHAP